MFLTINVTWTKGEYIISINARIMYTSINNFFYQMQHAISHQCILDKNVNVSTYATCRKGV